MGQGVLAGFGVKEAGGGALGEIAGLLARLRPVVQRRAGLALALWGEAGVGKTHLAGRMLREAGCRSVSLHAAVSLGGLLRSLPRPTGRTALPAWAEGLLGRLEAGESAPPGRAADALAALLGALAPVVLHLDDLHEAGPERHELISALAPLVERSRGVGLLVTSRVAPPEGFAAHRLEPLSPQETRALLEGELGSALPEAAQRWVFERSAGNPLFALEYVRLLARQGLLWSDGRRWHWREPSAQTLPLTIEALIERQILEAGEDAAARRALEARALLPPGVSAEVWAEVAGLEPGELEEAQGLLTGRGILRGGNFAHPLFGEVRLKTLRPERRRALARRAIETLRPADPQAAARFVVQAELEPEESFGLLQAAARAAGAAGDCLQSALLAAQAAEYAPPSQRGALALEAAQALRPFSLVEATQAARHALEAEPGSVEAAYLLAELLAHRGLQAEVEAVLARLPRHLRGGPEWLGRQLGVRSALGDSAGVARLWEAHPELHSHLPPATWATVADALIYLGRFPEATALVEDGLGRGGLDPVGQALLSRALGRLRFYAGRMDEAAALLEAALADLRAHSPGLEVALTLFRRGLLLYYLNRFVEAQAALEEGLELFTALGDGRWCAVHKHFLGTVCAVLGQRERSEELLLESHEYLSRLDVSDHLVNVSNALAWHYTHGGTAMSRLLGLKYARSAHAAALELGSPRARLNAGVQLITALAHSGDPHSALRLAEEHLAELRGMDYPYILALTLDGYALALEALGRADEAARAWAEAAWLLRAVNNPGEAERAEFHLERLRGDLSALAARLERAGREGHHWLLKLAQADYPHLLAPEAGSGPPAAGGRLEVLGPMQLRTGSGVEPLRGGKRQELLALLLEARLAGRGGADKHELLEELYPGEPEERAGAALRDLVRGVRAQLGAATLETTPVGYALGAGVSSDAEAFLRGGETGLWRGPYLEGLSESGHNEAVRDSLYLALRSRVEALMEADPKEAARLGRILLEADPYDGAVLRLALEALRQSGNHRSLSRVYQAARGRMLEVGAVLPPNWADFLAAKG